MNDEKMTVERFYHAVAEILGTKYDCEGFPWHKRTRWNNRKPGHGRFEGYGLVRVFGDLVQVALVAPQPVSKTINGREAALEYLKTL